MKENINFLKLYFLNKTLKVANIVFPNDYKEISSNLEINESEKIETIPNGSLNLVCLDNSSTYDDIRKDISMWVHKLSDNGIMCGTNYNTIDVAQAVNQFTTDCNIELHVKGKNPRDWWFIKPCGINHLPVYMPPIVKSNKRLRILALAWTTFDNETELMINSRRDLLCPAVDGLTNELLNLGHSVVYVNVFAEYKKDIPQKDLDCLGMISGLKYHLWKDIKTRDFDLIWHCVKDPTPSQALPYYKKIMEELDPNIPVLNNVELLKDHTKRKYIKLMREKNVGAIILKDELAPFMTDGKLDYQNKCFPPSQACYVTKDYYAIRLPLQNSNRRHFLFSPEGGITLKYQNTAKYPGAKPGFREFFRIPYAVGKCLEGMRYVCPEDVLCPKSGAAVERIPFTIPDMTAGTISACMNELGVDIAHIEGIKAGFTVEIFDVNPFPSSHGASLQPMAEKIAQRLTQVYAI